MYNDKPPGGSKSLNHGHTKGELKQMSVTVPNLLSVILKAFVILDFLYSPFSFLFFFINAMFDLMQQQQMFIKLVAKQSK